MTRRVVQIGTGRMSYFEAGHGEPLVLLHAFPLNAEMWEPQLASLSAKWRVVAPDLRGFARASEEGRAAGCAVSLDDYADDVAALLRHLEIDRAVVGGLSMGGYITFALLRRWPQMFRGLLLADTRPDADTDEGRANRRRLQEVARREGAAGVARDMLPKLLGDTTKRARPELADRVVHLAEHATADGVISALAAMLERPDSTPLLEDISVPTLILVGAEDVVTPPALSDAMHRAIARSELVVIPRAGHLSSLEAPAAFNDALLSFSPESRVPSPESRVP
ncbi:MAG: alpha/beta fold hydrolase [Acidobacteria bacterium]|nr:alpha/beta fold hydrolase [Acidobacteriota bacterium]